MRLPPLVLALVVVPALAAGPVRAAAPPRLPAGFLLGVATSGYQTEGGDTGSNWAAWQGAHPPDVAVEPIGQAVDFLHRYAQDIARARRLGLGAFRLSVEWSRIEPAPGEIDQAALAHYRAVLTLLRRKGLEPVVTLSHFTWPQWLEAQATAAGAPSAWEYAPSADAFARYATTVAAALGDLIRYYVTLNEPNGTLVTGYVLAYMPPGIAGDPLVATGQRSMYRALCGLMAAHAAAYDAVHAADPDAMVSSNVAVNAFHGPLASLTDSALLPDYVNSALFFDLLAGTPVTLKIGETCDQLHAGLPGPAPQLPGRATQDYVALDYYYSFDHIPEPRQAQDAIWTMQLHAPSLLDTLRRCAARMPGLPIFILENGMATENTAPRADGWTREAHLVQHVAQVQAAAAEGIPVQGYFYWSLTDNYEWGSYTPRFGLFRVDAASDPRLRRRPRAAARIYRHLARHRGVTATLLRRFPPPPAP